LALGSLRSTNTRRSRISDGLPATSKDRVRTVCAPSATGVGAGDAQSPSSICCSTRATPECASVDVPLTDGVLA
jgi:hypothetical protein